MNLELLDPFRRQIPDRVDSTLTLPTALHKPPAKADQDPEWKAAYHLAFNRRGTYLAVGHATGTVAVHDFLSRTLSAVYSHQPKDEAASEPLIKYVNGVTSVSWSRRSRSLLAGASGDANVRLIDTTHPFGPEECCFVAPTTNEKLDNDDGDNDERPKARGSLAGTNIEKPIITLFKEPKNHVTYLKTARRMSVCILETSEGIPAKAPLQVEEKWQNNVERFPIAMFELPDAVAGSLQIHPKDNTTGLAVLASGELVLFRAPGNVWYKLVGQQSDDDPVVKVVTVWKGESSVTSASFSHNGDRIFLATKSGDMIGIDIGHVLYCLGTTAQTLPLPDVVFRLSVGSMAWHLLVSRNGKYILLNCADGGLRLYLTNECVQGKSKAKPKLFQDVVSKEPFVCCDFSGDGEFIVGGCNGVRDDKYELYLWNTATGALMDRLTGAQVSLYSVAWHPTRSFLAAATSDGLVDVWGPRMDWTAFAPDFQALPMNVEYVEQEDEFDVVTDDDENEASGGDEEDNIIDVVTVEAVPVFASDSESESEVFTFETKMSNLMFGRGRNHAKADGNLGKEE
ncbi:hypothetical protein MHU86_4226 [Fragilaria crotonensis]|nr:hypothetical protein MHU86_4226 [Fragilaria crotonensis]